jgi:hypothetical protein
MDDKSFIMHSTMISYQCLLFPFWWGRFEQLGELLTEPNIILMFICFEVVVMYKNRVILTHQAITNPDCWGPLHGGRSRCLPGA